MSAADWLAERRRIEQAATDGPWMSEWDTSDQWWTIHGQPNPAKGDDRMVCPEVATLNHREDWTADVEFIAATRTFVPKALAALDAVLALIRARTRTPAEDGSVDEYDYVGELADDILAAIEQALS